MSFPTRSQIYKDPIWKIKDVVARPSLDTFYQVDFSFSKYNKWLKGDPTASGKRSGSFTWDRFRSDQNLANGSTRVEGSDFMRKMSLLCSEAEIPGTSYLTEETVSDHQGISEAFPILRQFPPLNLTFYLDYSHVVLEVIETWMKFINPIYSDDKQLNAYSRFNYPEDYKERIHLTKYERDWAKPNPRDPNSSIANNSSLMSQYEFVNCWPQNLTSMRLNYGGSNVLKVQVQFSYDRFFTKFALPDSRPMVEDVAQGIVDSKLVKVLRGQGNRNIFLNRNRGGGGKRQWDGNWFGNLGK